MAGAGIPPLNQTTAEIGKDALTVYGDIIKEDDVQTLVEKTFLRLGGIDISTNNEGSFLSLPFHEISEEQWDFLLDVNLRSFSC